MVVTALKGMLAHKLRMLLTGGLLVCGAHIGLLANTQHTIWVRLLYQGAALQAAESNTITAEVYEGGTLATGGSWDVSGKG